MGSPFRHHGIDLAAHLNRHPNGPQTWIRTWDRIVEDDHDTIANFRHQHLEPLAGLFVHVLRLCEKAGLVKLGQIAIDGTKMLANASTHHSLPYKKLNQREQYWESVVQALLQQAATIDQREDEQFGQGRIGDALPEELAHAQSRLERIRRAKAELEQEARQELEARSSASSHKTWAPA